MSSSAQVSTAREPLRFELQGESPHLEDLVRLFPTTVKNIEEHYRLQLPERESPLEDKEALEAGKAELSRLNGIALLVLGNFHRPGIRGILKRNPATGKLGTIHCASLNIGVGVSMHLAAQVKLPDGTIATNQAPAYVEVVLKLTETNKYLDHALIRYGQEEHDWPGLYKVFDAIRGAFNGNKGLIKQQFVTESEIDDFKEHANPHRHGFRERKRKESTHGKKEMTLVEAQAWIGDLLKAWIKKLTSG